MSEQKPKKPFLKKGTRQFLSNATVRSLSQKPRIVQYNQDDNLQTFNTPFSNNNNKKDSRQQIVIAVKPKNISKQKPQSASNNIKQNSKKTSNFGDKQKQIQNQNNFQQTIQINTKPTSSSNSLSKGSQKKPTLLTDYLNNDSKSNKKPTNIPAQIPKAQPIKQNIQPAFQSQAQNLRMQNIEDDSDEDHGHKNKIKYEDDQEENEFMTRNKKPQPSPEQIRKIQQLKKKPNLLQQMGKKQKQNINIQNNQDKQQQNGINFQSDSDDDKPKKNQFKSKGNKLSHQNRFKQDIQNEDGNNEDDEQMNRKTTVKLGTKPQSKVAQMFNKNSNNQNKVNSQPANEPQSIKPSKMTIQDIPKQLIQQIVQKYFKQAKQKYQKKQQNLIQQVRIVQNKLQSVNSKQKQIQKRMKQFDKQIQQKRQQFENKIKNQQNKIARQKMYLKDQQTTGKMDFKTKTQIQQLKQLLQHQKNDKKKIQVKIKGQLDRLKTKYQQEVQINKNLQNRIKQYQLKEIQQRQLKNKQEKQAIREIKQRKKQFWENAPKTTFLSRFYSKDFSLNQFPMQQYFHQKNQFYQYYLQKGDSDTLVRQQAQGNKIKRIYQNGKQQIQSPKKFIKQIFTWGYIIVHYCNGDIKQIINLPNSNHRLEIYFAKAGLIVEYSISDGRKIHYFLKINQIQLQDSMMKIKQVYTGNQLQRIQQGNVKMLQKNAKGKFVQTY